MAGWIVVRKLEKATPPQSMLDGIHLWKWDEADGMPQKMLFKVDPDLFFLSGHSTDPSKTPVVWDLVLVSDVRSGKLPKDGKSLDVLINATGGEPKEECVRSIVYRMDGITKLHFTHVYAENWESAKIFADSVNKFAHHLLDHHLSVQMYMKKHYVRMCLEANGRGQLPLKTVTKYMMVQKSSKDDIKSYFVSAKTNVKEMDNGTPYIEIKEFTEAIYMNLVDTLLQNRGPDLDVLKKECNIKARKQYLDAKEFANFFNTQQRDPRLNDILFPRVNAEQAMVTMEKYGGDTDRLTMNHLLQYLMSEDNLIIDPVVFDQSQDMGKPLNHYFINSSHNTYLNGHQVRSESLPEMYIQVLLTGCRCVELDCWPRNDFEDIIITHGNTLCTKVPFKDVVEAINEYAFVASDYPVILSIENHCNRYPKLIDRMDEIFRDVFGDKLLAVPLGDYPLEPGVPLPSPELLKRKIVIKDKVSAPKGGSSNANTGTLQRTGTIPEVVEEIEPPKEENQTQTKEEADNIAPLPSANKNNQSSLRPMVKRPSLFKGMTILEDTDDGIQSDSPSMRKTPSLEKGNSDDKPSSEEKQPVEEKSNPPVQKKISMEKKESVDESSAPVNSPTKKENESGEPEKKKYERGEALGASSYTEMLNYITAISFVSFEHAEKMNCNYIMSSFGEEKGMNLIKSKPKEFVRYNIRQNSRIYPAGGSRMNSSNYMPQIYWNIGSQMVALNFQTSDMPMQVNYAKFEMNGGTGYILKPSVLSIDRGFNPFVQKKIEDVVPARLSVKIISGMFITSKRTDLMVEVEMYGLPADIVRRQFTKKRSPAPNPFWDEDYFVFKRVLMPELALLRLVVFDSDHVFIGQRVLPVNHLRAGFRHVSLRDKHNSPLGIANLFLHIKIEDYIPDEFEEFVTALENPLKFATLALEQLAMGTDATGDEDEFAEADRHPREREPSAPTIQTPKITLEATDNPTTTNRKVSAPPELLTKEISQIPSVASVPSSMDTLRKGSTMGIEKTFPLVEEAKSRDKVDAVPHDSSIVMENPDYIKMQKRFLKSSSDLAARHDKAVKKLQSDQGKAIAKLSKKKNAEDQVKEMEGAHRNELMELKKHNKEEIKNMEKQYKIELHEKQKFLLGIAHSTQRKLIEKAQKTDLDKVSKEIVQEVRRKKKDEKNNQNKDLMRSIEQDVFSMGIQTRSELSKIHENEMKYFQNTIERAVKNMEEAHAKEMEKLEQTDTSLEL